MRKMCLGFTFIELLFVIVIMLGVFFILLLPAGERTYKSRKVEVQRTIAQLSQALLFYQSDEGEYPPNEVTAASEYKDGPETTDKVYQYYSCTLIPYLDGDKETLGIAPGEGTSKITYFNFPEHLIEINNLRYVCRDVFDSEIWYHNFHTQKKTIRDEGKDEGDKPYHPHYVAYNIESFQLYSKIDKENEPYLDNKEKKRYFQWITNYITRGKVTIATKLK